MIGNNPLHQALTCVVIVLNHERFVCECLESIQREFDHSPEILVIDLGSMDATLSLTTQFLESYPGDSSIIVQPVKLRSSVGAIQTAARVAAGEFLMIISGDDYLGTDAGREALKCLGLVNQNCALNFRQVMFSDSSSLTRMSNPRWTSRGCVNQTLLFYENLGKAPGAIIPRNLVLRSIFMKMSPKCLVEDYPLWLSLRRTVTFHVINRGAVFYRQHDQSLSRRRSSPEYSWSLGYCIGMAESLASNVFEKVLARIGRGRWYRQVDKSMRQEVDRGRLAAKRDFNH